MSYKTPPTPPSPEVHVAGPGPGKLKQRGTWAVPKR